jgi:ERF superfamily protein
MSEHEDNAPFPAPAVPEPQPSRGLLFAALAKAQGVMESAVKDAENPAFKSKYADLESVWNACREPLAANGLAVIQLPATEIIGGKCRVSITTVLGHSSGQEISSIVTVEAADLRPWSIASAATYGRRLGLAPIVGVAPGDDDDGQQAQNGSASAPPQPKRREPPAPPQRQIAPTPVQQAQTSLPASEPAKVSAPHSAPQEAPAQADMTQSAGKLPTDSVNPATFVEPSMEQRAEFSRLSKALGYSRASAAARVTKVVGKAQGLSADEVDQVLVSLREEASEKGVAA